METIAELGAWSWMIAAAVLFVLELIAPGIFFMWFGAAALATALIAFRYDITWQWQLIWFCGLSLASILLSAGICAATLLRATSRCSTSGPRNWLANLSTSSIPL